MMNSWPHTEAGAHVCGWAPLILVGVVRLPVVSTVRTHESAQLRVCDKSWDKEKHLFPHRVPKHCLDATKDKCDQGGLLWAVTVTQGSIVINYN